MTEGGNQEAVRQRFAATAALQAALEETRRAELAEKVRTFVAPRGDERALDAGTGTGALAFALAPIVREVVAADLVPELLREGRARAALFPNVTFVEADATHLDFHTASFDLAGCLRTLHHVAHPALVVAELTRVTRPGGRILVADQIAPFDPIRALALDRFEQARDPSHSRCLSDAALHGLFAANGLVLITERVEHEKWELERYLDLAGCEGAARRDATALAPGATFTTILAWYLLMKPAP